MSFESTEGPPQGGPPDRPLSPFPLIDGDQFEKIDSSWLCEHTRLFVDTSSLLADGFGRAMSDALMPALAKTQQNVLVLSRTIEHLKALASNPQEARRARAVDALGLLSRMQSKGMVVDVADPHPVAGSAFGTASLFAEMFVRYQLEAMQCLMTQDDRLALQIIRNSRLQSIQGAKPAIAVYIENGMIKNWVPKLLSKPQSVSTTAPRERGPVPIAGLVAREFKIIADTSSLMLVQKESGEFRGIEFFGKVLLPLLQQARAPLLIPMRVVAELQKLQRSDDARRRTVSTAALEVLNQFDAAGLLVRGEDENELQGASAQFADPVFVQLMVRFQASHDLCFITQDTNLARGLIYNRASNGVRQVLVTFLPMRGSLNPVEWETRLERPQSGQPAAPTDRSDNSQEGVGGRSTYASVDLTPRTTPFELPAVPRPLDDTPLHVTQVPVVGDWVHGIRTGMVLLRSEIAAGGEGTIYATQHHDVVCKIYHAEKLTHARREKLDLMLSRDVQVKGVCWPTDLASTSTGEFVGYMMPKASGKTLRTTVFGKPLLQRNFPSWTREQLTQLAITILRAVERLHRLNVFVGDINPLNILVQDEHTICLVDIDSVQVGGFPCPVGTETYTPPERQGKAYTDFLRTERDELFAVTTLLFQILFPGNAPYSSQGGGEVAENIRNMRFAYGRDAEGRPPVGAWQFIWSHLHPALKDDFTKVFRHDERVPIGDLIKHLLWCQNEIREGKRSGEVFPAKPWMREGDTVLMRCDSCPPDHPGHDVSRTFAEVLRNDGRAFRCSACSAFRKIKRLEETREVECNLNLSPRCEGRSTVSIARLERLKAAGQQYSCRTCGEVMRLQRAQPSASPYIRAPHHTARTTSTNTTASSSSGSSCFVATATYRAANVPQVAFLRGYRDTVLVPSRFGRLFIKTYYAIGPWLARPVDRFPALQSFMRILLDKLVRQLARQRPDIAETSGVNDLDK